jgi:hypothetical protein
MVNYHALVEMLPYPAHAVAVTLGRSEGGRLDHERRIEESRETVA